MSGADSFDTFYRASRQRLYDCLYALTGNAAEAQDAVHAAYARAWQRWATVADYGDPEAWVRTVARRVAVSRWRRARSALRAYRRAGPPPDLPGPDPDSLVLADALAQLPLPQRRSCSITWSVCRWPRWRGRPACRWARSRPVCPAGAGRSPPCST
jgi:DNA-directed RNA polymerase specialized sigma24 family protein